jgi:integrase
LIRHARIRAGQQSVYNLFAHLRSVVLWALQKKTASGRTVLQVNPLSGMAKRLKIRPNKTPMQPVIAHATFTALRRGARRLPMYVRVFLIMAEGTGRRAGSIRNLEWPDVSFKTDRILWKGSTDKMGLQMARAVPPNVMRYLRVWKRHCPSDRFVFPAPTDPTSAVPKATVDKWARQAYTAAGLEKPDGTGWHSLRRKWASERDGYPIPVLMAAGGWASAEALMRYLKTDDATLTTAIQNPTRRVGGAKVRTEVRTASKAGSPKVA